MPTAHHHLNVHTSQVATIMQINSTQSPPLLLSIFVIMYLCFCCCFQVCTTSMMHSMALANVSVDLDSSNLGPVSFRESRYSYFWTFEYYCTDKCRRQGKRYGRLIGFVCRCFCPQIDDTDYCTGNADMSCSMYCKKQGYSTGDCIYQNKCFCFCRPRQPYPPCPGNDPIPEYVEFAPKNCPPAAVNSTGNVTETEAATNTSTSQLDATMQQNVTNSTMEQNMTDTIILEQSITDTKLGFSETASTEDEPSGIIEVPASTIPSAFSEVLKISIRILSYFRNLI